MSELAWRLSELGLKLELMRKTLFRQLRSLVALAEVVHPLAVSRANQASHFLVVNSNLTFLRARNWNLESVKVLSTLTSFGLDLRIDGSYPILLYKAFPGYYAFILWQILLVNLNAVVPVVISLQRFAHEVKTTLGIYCL